MSFFNTVTIDIGSQEPRPDVSHAVLALEHLTASPFFERNGRDTLSASQRLVSIISNTFGALPWKQKTSMGYDKPSRLMHILPGAATVDPLTGALVSGFRVQFDADTDTVPPGIVLYGRSLFCVQGKARNRPDPGSFALFRRFVIGRMPSYDELEFIYVEYHAELKPHVESTVVAICSSRYGPTSNVAPRLLWTLVDGVDEGWLCVGLKKNSTSRQVVYDPSSFTVLLLTDAELQVKNEVLPMTEKCSRLFSRILDSQCSAAPFAVSTPALVSMKGGDAGRVMFRSEKCDEDVDNKPDHGHDKYEDKEVYNVDGLIADIARNNGSGGGIFVTEIGPHRASRTTFDADYVNKLDDDAFLAYHTYCDTEWIPVNKNNFGRLSSFFRLLSALRSTPSFDACVRIEGEAVLFRNFQLKQHK